MHANPPPTLPADSLPQGAVRLADWGVLRAAGADARSFLHSQLTQDTLHLQTGQATLAGYCSPKGRLLASFVVWQRAPDELLLACSADLLPALLKRLSMFVLRAKCRLSDASADVPLWGLAGAAADRALGAGAPVAAWRQTVVGGHDVVRLPDVVVPNVMLSDAVMSDAVMPDAVVPDAVVPDAVMPGAVGAGAPVARFLWAGAEPPALPALAPGSWRWLEVMSGVARIVHATTELFVPQMVNLELVGGVNFQKGCYPGQEVVARSQYRGTVKRRAQVLLSAQPLAPGEAVFHSDDPGQPAGTVVLAGTLAAAQHAALVELKTAALAGGTLHAGSAQGALLTPAALPYALAAAADS